MSDMAVGNGEVVIDVSMNGSSTKQTITVIASAYPLYVPKLSQSSLRFFPNPASDVLNVELSNVENGAVVEVYNVIGKKLMVFPVYQHGNRFVVPVANLPRGSYFLRVSQDGEVLTRKFQKTN
jgi:hypothetical protein